MNIRNLSPAELRLTTYWYKNPNLNSTQLGEYFGKKASTVKYQIMTAAKKLGGTNRYQLLRLAHELLWMCSKCGAFNNKGVDECIFCVAEELKRNSVTATELAEILGVTRNRVHGALEYKHFPYVRIDGHRWIRREYIPVAKKHFREKDYFRGGKNG